MWPRVSVNFESITKLIFHKFILKPLFVLFPFSHKLFNWDLFSFQIPEVVWNISRGCHENETFPVAKMDKFDLIEISKKQKNRPVQICCALTSLWIPIWFSFLGNLFVGEWGGRVSN